MPEKKVYNNKPKNRFALLDSDDDEPKVQNNVVVQNEEEDNKKSTTKTIDDEVIENLFGKKESNKSYKNKVSTTQEKGDGGFVMVTNKKKEKFVGDLQIKEIEEDFFDLNMPNTIRVLAHHIDDKNWDCLNYHNITTLQTWGDVPRFFNTLNIASGECKFTDFDIFLMKNEISPMWEDSENRNGSIFSIKIDSIEQSYEVLKILTYHLVNNTILKFSPERWDVINGLSYVAKKMEHIGPNVYWVIIKIWFKINILNLGHGQAEKLLSDDVQKLISGFTVKIKPIKPEY